MGPWLQREGRIVVSDPKHSGGPRQPDPPGGRPLTQKARKASFFKHFPS